MFTVELFMVAKTWKQAECPLADDWRKKMWSTHTMGYCSVIRRDEILPSVTIWMGLENIMLNEINQTEEIKNHSYVEYKTKSNN